MSIAGWFDIESQSKRYEADEQRQEPLKNKINVHAYKNSFLTTQRTEGASITEINPLITGVCYDHSEHTNKMRGKNSGF